MNEAQLRAVIDQVLGEVPFDPPISVTYCQAVYRALRAVLPKDAIAEVYFRRDTLVVELRHGQVQHKLELELS